MRIAKSSMLWGRFEMSMRGHSFLLILIMFLFTMTVQVHGADIQEYSVEPIDGIELINLTASESTPVIENLSVITAFQNQSNICEDSGSREDSCNRSKFERDPAVDTETKADFLETEVAPGWGRGNCR